MSLSATALTTIGRASEYSGLASTDPNLITLINAASKKIEGWCGRNFLSQTYSEQYELPGPEGVLVLNQPEVTQVTYLAVETNQGLTITYTGSDTNARVEVTDTSVVLVSRAGGTTTTNTLTFASNATTAAMATAASAVSGWSASSLATYPSAYLVRKGAQSAKSATVSLDVWKDWDAQYTPDYRAGTIRIYNAPWPIRSDPTIRTSAYPFIQVGYTAGLTAVPADVEMICLQLVADGKNTVGRDSSVQSESLGDYSVSYIQSQMTSIDTSPAWTECLWPYRRTLP